MSNIVEKKIIAIIKKEIEKVPSRDEIVKIIKLIASILSIVVVIVAATRWVVIPITNNTNDINNLKLFNEEVKGKMDTYGNTLDDLQSTVKSTQEIVLELSANSKKETAYNINFLDDYGMNVENLSYEKFSSGPSWEGDFEYLVAKDPNSDTSYKKEDLYNVPIMTSYMQDGNEVYFLGRYNENNNWNGKCILNVYNGNNLVSIFEAVYNNGNIYSYKRAACEDNETWIVTDRINQGAYNIGETWIYTKNSEFVKDFTINDFKEKQIITVENFLESKNEKILSYYNGRTSNGYYNDDTGKAYLVKYKDDGNVKYLYVGKTKNGKEHDNTEKAWFIAWGDADDGYYFYQGKFTNGKHGDAPKNWKPKTQDEINNIINPNDFKCSLTGLIDTEPIM